MVNKYFFLGTLGTDIPGMVSRFHSGIEYTAKVDQYLKDFGWIFTPFGKVSSLTETQQWKYVHQQ
jgi:hypothetical protein